MGVAIMLLEKTGFQVTTDISTGIAFVCMLVRGLGLFGLVAHNSCDG